MKKPEDENPNETIQMDGIEGLADVQLVDEEPPVPSSRAVPPPLPPGLGLLSPSMRPSAAPPAPPPKSRTGLYAGVFVVMVVVAVGGGLTIGSALRGTPAATSASPPPGSAPAAAAPASAAATPAGADEPHVLVLPTIELADVDANAK